MGNVVLTVPAPAYADDAVTKGGLDIRTGPPGTALTWGYNGSGQLGDGNTPVDSRVPGRVCGNATCTTALDKVVQVAAGGLHSVALLDDGSLLSWGDNGHGQLGDGTRTARTTPVRVCAVGEPAPCAAFLRNVVAVSAGNAHSLALLADGTVVSWGDNTYGELGDGTAAPDRTSPVQVCAVGATAPCGSYLSNVTSISAGYVHSLALRTGGSVNAWGYNGSGALGDGSTTNRNVPVHVGGAAFSGVSVAGGVFHSVMARDDGSVLAWGEGQALGDGVGELTTLPVRVCAPGATAPCTSYLSGVTSVAAGALHTLALRNDETVFAWGVNDGGQLGNNTTTPSAVPVQVCAPADCVTTLSGVTAVAAGSTGDHSLALRFDGSVRAWGTNFNGQLGDGTSIHRLRPVPVCAVGQTAPCTRFLEGVTAISAGSNFSAAVFRPLADLATSISASPEPVADGGTLVYTIRVRNFGPTAAEKVVLTDHLPATVRFVSASTSSGNCDTPAAGSTDSVVCHLGTVPKGGTATVTLSVRVRAAGGGVTDSASATSDTPDPSKDNNTATITTPVG
ncbi:hypothetical protein ACIGO8_13490 [Streptomyces sp. NPDC053493]|uniref:RCC1 domain-containing protein n=1 Tax=Streptomyces sp. NPDC053493 TaxID=3365705 RepID=UPI0037D0FF6C